MLNDPLPDLDLPESVRIQQQAIASKQEEEIGSRPNAKWQKSSCGALRADDIRDGDSHGLLRLSARRARLSLRHSTTAVHNFE